jgi:hypothetical protein
MVVPVTDFSKLDGAALSAPSSLEKSVKISKACEGTQPIYQIAVVVCEALLFAGSSAGVLVGV